MPRSGALVALVGLVSLAAACGGGRGAPNTTPANEGTGPTYAPTASSTATATVPATPTATPKPGVDAPTVELKEGAPIELPENLVLYYFGGKVPLEGRPDTLLRAYRHGGATVIEDVLRTLPVKGTPFSFAIDAERQRIAVSVCVRGDCFEHNLIASASTEDVVLLSSDGGASWTELGPVPEQSFISGFEGDEVAFAPLGLSSDGLPRLVLLPSREVITGPPGTQPSPDGSRSHTWRRGEDGALLDRSGTVIQVAPRIPGSHVDPSGSILSRLNGIWTAYPFGGTPLFFLLELKATGAVARAVRIGGIGDIAAVARLNVDTLVMNRYFPPGGGIGDTALLSLATGEYRTISGLRRPQDRDAYPLTASTGPIARIKAPGSCLNIREQPVTSSASLGCFADGVLLRLNGAAQAIDGRDWYPVQAPGSEANGYAAAEFLER